MTMTIKCARCNRYSPVSHIYDSRKHIVVCACGGRAVVIHLNIAQVENILNLSRKDVRKDYALLSMRKVEESGYGKGRKLFSSKGRKND